MLKSIQHTPYTYPRFGVTIDEGVLTPEPTSRNPEGSDKKPPRHLGKVLLIALLTLLGFAVHDRSTRQIEVTNTQNELIACQKAAEHPGTFDINDIEWCEALLQKTINEAKVKES